MFARINLHLASDHIREMDQILCETNNLSDLLISTRFRLRKLDLDGTSCGEVGLI